MSASLVGSEMCIRDRALGSALWGGLRICADSEPRRGQFGSSGELKRAPVSYTHLTLPTICSV
eukprot:13524214-Alexandrium_andersonii.AAC.1